MIPLRKLNNEEIWLNPLLVELVTANPDSVITLSNGHKYVVRESPDEVARLIRSFLQGLSLRIPSEYSAQFEDEAEHGAQNDRR